MRDDWGVMTGQLHEAAPATGPGRSDAGVMRLGQRDIDGLILCAEHFGAPYDLLADAPGARQARLRGVTARWRRAGYAATGRLGPGPAWCWLASGYHHLPPYRRVVDADERNPQLEHWIAWLGHAADTTDRIPT
jgi:hypothetical protein